MFGTLTWIGVVIADIGFPPAFTGVVPRNLRFPATDGGVVTADIGFPPTASGEVRVVPSEVVIRYLATAPGIQVPDIACVDRRRTYGRQCYFILAMKLVFGIWAVFWVLLFLRGYYMISKVGMTLIITCLRIGI